MNYKPKFLLNNKLKIITGKLKGRYLILNNNKGIIRPTTSLMRETIWNWLKNSIKQYKCLDCFSGSGILGIEALSQGAKFVTFIEKNRYVINTLKKNLFNLYNKVTNYILVKNNILNILNHPKKYKHIYLQYNLVFLDPPFYQGLLQPTLELLIKFNWIHKGSLVYIEYEKKIKNLIISNNLYLYKEKIKTNTIHRLYVI